MLDIGNLNKSITKELNNMEDIDDFINLLEEKLKDMEMINKEYTVDRLEEGYAVCEDRKTKEIVNIEISKLPDGIKDGTILKYENGKYFLAPEEEKEISDRIQQKMNDLWTN